MIGKRGRHHHGLLHVFLGGYQRVVVSEAEFRLDEELNIGVVLHESGIENVDGEEAECFPPDYLQGIRMWENENSVELTFSSRKNITNISKDTM